jgi:hypothetical protein
MIETRPCLCGRPECFNPRRDGEVRAAWLDRKYRADECRIFAREEAIYRRLETPDGVNPYRDDGKLLLALQHEHSAAMHELPGSIARLGVSVTIKSDGKPTDDMRSAA